MKLTQEQAKKLLEDVPASQTFKVHLGAEVTNLRELAAMIEVMDENSFKHHVTERKNDFSTWIKYTLADHELAKQVNEQQKQSKIAKIIQKRVRTLEIIQRGNTFTCGLTDFLTGTVIGIILGVILASLL